MSERVTHIGNYRVERELAQEERRTIYQGWQMSLNRPVQITQLTAPAAADAEFLARWKLAARDLRDPGHPQLPRILDAQFLGEHPYLVESYLVADTLAGPLSTGRDLATSLRLVAGIADALGYAHRRGWAHGAVGIDSVRVMEDGSAYLIDLPWQAAQRPKGDAVAMKSDVQAMLALFAALRQPIAGTAQPLTGRAADDAAALGAWLARGEPAESSDLSAALAPVLLRGLTGDIATCDQLADSLRPLAPGLKAKAAAPSPPSATIVKPPPGSPAPAAVAPAAVAPVYQPPMAPPPIAPPIPQQRSSRRGLGAALVVLLLVAGLVAAGVLLCRTGVLPFCVSCDEGLIAQYLSGARAFAEREAWSDAARELQSAAGECATCSAVPAACDDTQQLQDVAACHLEFEDSVANGEKLLGNDDPCLAVERFEQAIEQAPMCDADVSLARSFLARNSDGGAYTRCAQQQLALAGTESNPDKRAAQCQQAHELLAKAHQLKPTAASIAEAYTQAERFAALQVASAAGKWDDAAAALDELAVSVTSETYCGAILDEFRFDILIGQGAARVGLGQLAEALARFQEAEPLASTLAQQNRLAEALAQIPADALTPSATPTFDSTPTPAAAATPFLTSRGANIRACPNTSCAVKRKAAQGAAFAAQCTVAEKDGKWVKVPLDGDEGWVRSDVVTLKGSPPACPAGELTPTPVAAAQPTPSLPQQPAASAGGECRAERSLPAVSLAAPPKDQTCSGPVRFSWQASYGLSAGEAFEIHIWPDRNQNKGRIKQTRDTSVVVDLRSEVPWINWNELPHFWEVVVVCRANGRIVSNAPNARLFYFDQRMPVDSNPDNNCR